MAKRGRQHGRKSHRRGRRGGANTPLGYGSYPAAENSGGSWAATVTGNPAAAASGYKSFLSNFSAGSPQQNAMALNKFAMTGPGQTGGSRRRRARKAHSSRRRHRGGSDMVPAVATDAGSVRASAAPAASSTSGGQSGGMFASFGSLLKEALVPLGLLAVQQTYGRKRKGSKHYTRKYRK